MLKFHNNSNGTGQPAIKGQCISVKAMYSHVISQPVKSLLNNSLHNTNKNGEELHKVKFARLSKYSKG